MKYIYTMVSMIGGLVCLNAQALVPPPGYDLPREGLTESSAPAFWKNIVTKGVRDMRFADLEILAVKAAKSVQPFAFDPTWVTKVNEVDAWEKLIEKYTEYQRYVLGDALIRYETGISQKLGGLATLTRDEFETRKVNAQQAYLKEWHAFESSRDGAWTKFIAERSRNMST